MNKLASGLIGAVAGYAAGASAGALLVAVASANRHDKSVEMVVTALLIVGPIGAVIGLTAGLLSGRRKAARRDDGA